MNNVYVKAMTSHLFCLELLVSHSQRQLCVAREITMRSGMVGERLNVCLLAFDCIELCCARYTSLLLMTDDEGAWIK